MTLKKIIFYIIGLFICIPTAVFSGVVTGHVTDVNGESLAFTSVYIKNTTYGVSTNLNGEYLIELENGSYIIVFSYVGYETIERSIVVEDNKTVKLDIVMSTDAKVLGTIEIVSNTVDKAKAIMKLVRKKRSFYKNQIESFQCETYVKTSLEKENKERFDSLKIASNAGSFEEQLKKEKMNLIESFSEYYYERSNKYKEVIIAHHDYSEIKRSAVQVSFNYEGRSDIVSTTYMNSNPYILYENILSGDYNFYRNNISISRVTEKPLLSPIASSSALSYTYDYEGAFEENGRNIHRIRVKPRFSADALFEGVIFIQDSTWALLSVDLRINRAVLKYCSQFRVIQNYKEIEPNHFVPIRRSLDYTIKDGGNYIMGNTRINFKSYDINPQFPAKTFSNEVIHYKKDAFDKEENYWSKVRPITLKIKELKFVHKADSLRLYYDSDLYKLKRDSIYNNVNFWSVLLTGVGYRNTATGNEYYFNPIIAQVLPFGIGGYRHRMGGHYNKRFDNGNSLIVYPEIDYGFNNKDVKGSVQVGYTYMPLKFVKTSITIGDQYVMVNDYESIRSTFSRNNYVNKLSLGIAQRMELVNGLYGEISFNYAHQKPITGLKLSKWSEKLFGELNEPQKFDPYTRSELKLELQYRINQKYLIRRNRKIILETKYPQLSLIYRKGVKGLFDSEVDYDYLELGARAKSKLGRWGSSRWEVNAGKFINKKNLRLLEYKYFRGSDVWFFSDPMQSFQLLGPTLNTANGFLRGAYIHHFNGTILNKIPLINKLKISLVGGVGALLIEDNDFRHAELFAGIERVFRIKKELIRVGIYGVTSDDNHSKAKFRYKIGISFYNSFIGEWNY